MTELTEEEVDALKGMKRALETAGDGDLETGLKVMVGMLKLVRTTGEDDPLKGLEKIREALKTAANVEKYGRFVRWLILAVIGALMTGQQLFDSISKWLTILRSGGKAP